MEFIGAGGGGGSGDEQETQRGRKTYIRHTSEQTAKLEAMFAESPHPDEGQRRKLARELGLEPKQVKFWFQNKRTQMKTQTERADNNALRAENQKIQRENFIIREALKKIICRSCRGPNQDDDTLKQLRLENARLKAEAS
ncbi:hypothetical protein RJT34_14491 [Clitoria ternatea]|uniref:Homeobox domain-containing protein n=1 Tax=Clitoria ternatea TaxID=43366 RepID=A0AAN9JSL6_CLITE